MDSSTKRRIIGRLLPVAIVVAWLLTRSPVPEVRAPAPGGVQMPATDTVAEITPQSSAPEFSAPAQDASRETVGSNDAQSSSQHNAQQAGKLDEIRPGVFRSAAGLMYLPGGAEGNRVEHVMLHSRDIPGKQIHGVFEGERETILALIDEAFRMSKEGGRDVRSEQQRQRLVMTVDLKRRIGYVGGEEGKRKQHPECRYLRIVLENSNEVISAYPTASY